MSEFQTVSSSEIELSDTELQCINGDATALGALALAMLEGAVTVGAGAHDAYTLVKGGYSLPKGKWA